MRSAKKLVISVTLCAAFAAGCSAFDEALLPPQPDQGGDGGGSDVCGKQPVPKPAGTDDGEDVGRQVFALRNVKLEQSAAEARSTGYSLDGLCTDGPEDMSECFPPGAGSELPIDGEDGIDNVFGSAFYQNVDTALQLSTLPSIEDSYPTDPPGCDPDVDDPCARLPFQDVARQAQDSGKGTLLMVVDGWNGTDTDVRMNVIIGQASDGVPCSMKEQVHFATSGEFVNELVWDDDSDPGTPDVEAPDPVWDGSEENCWWLRGDTFVNENPANGAIISDDAAYANGGRSVVNLPDGREILFFAGPVGAKVILTGGIASATLADGGERLTDLLVAGRWAISDLIATGPHVGVCDNCAEQDALTATLRSNADVRRGQPEEPSLDLECDAISMGVSFEEGIKGQLVTDSGGDLVLGPSPDLPNPCAM